MKILIFYQYFGTPKGKWSTRMYELARRWVEAGHCVTVVTAPYDKSDIAVTKFISNLSIMGINVIVINSGDSNRFSISKRVFSAVRFAFVSIWFAMTLKYDVCISSSGPITIGLPMIFAKKIRNKKTIFEVRDLWPAGGIEMGLIKTSWQKNLALWFEKLCYNSADVVVTASVGQKEHIIKRFDKLKIEVIPNASDIELFGKKVNSDKLPEWFKGKKLFTHIGSLGLIHSTTYWLEVAKELNELDVAKEICLVFIGDGKDKEFLISEKERLFLDNIVFLGLKPKEELPLWVGNSIGTLFATLDNEVQDACSPNKIFDSFAAGIPIVQTSKGWIKDLVESENCGINVSLNDPKNAALKILEMSKDVVKLDIMGKNALRLANTSFNRNLLAKEYLEIMKNI